MQDYFEQLADGALGANFMPKDEYVVAHQNLVIFCHDVFIKYKNGFLLVLRDNQPDKDKYWPIGGRVLRGMSTEKSLRIKVKEECNLELSNIKLIGFLRSQFNEDPFGHGKGTDTISLVYCAKGEGEIKLDGLHTSYVLVNKDNFDDFDGVPLCVRHFLEKSLHQQL